MNRIDRAFDLINRTDFVPSSLRDRAPLDSPLSIGFGQTISQPSTVRRMLEWLDAKLDDRILDIGSGSGWTTALLSHIIGPKGAVFAVERIPELLRMGEENCNKLGITNVKFFPACKEYGLPKLSPFDRILVSASAREFPKALLSQLKTGGKLVIPVQNDILEITKTTDQKYSTVKHRGYVFVPLI